jgi:tetratricopeptide (TPR) repeat protein
MLARTSLFLTGLSIALGTYLFWSSPLSPVAPHRARKLVLKGKIELAIELLELRARKSYSSSQKEEALWEAAQLAALRLEDPTRGIDLLEKCLRLEQFSHSSEAHAQLALLLYDFAMEEAIEHWQIAIALNPDHPQAQVWLSKLAMSYELKEDSEKAIETWQQIDDPNIRNVAELALGRLKLTTSPEEAYMHFSVVKDDIYLERAKTAELGQELARWQMAYQSVSKP